MRGITAQRLVGAVVTGCVVAGMAAFFLAIVEAAFLGSSNSDEFYGTLVASILFTAMIGIVGAIPAVAIGILPGLAIALALLAAEDRWKVARWPIIWAVVGGITGGVAGSLMSKFADASSTIRFFLLMTDRWAIPVCMVSAACGAMAAHALLHPDRPRAQS